MNNKIFMALIGVCVATHAHASCTIKYACGTGATGTAPANQTVANGARAFTPAGNTCTRDGYDFSHYLATVSSYTYANDGVAHPGAEYTIPFNGTYSCSNSPTVTLTAQWVESNPSVVASKSYTDSQMATRQPIFTGDANGANKIMMYDGATDGVVGSRDIVETLGTPNAAGIYSDITSTEVPTRGAIQTGVDRKQDTITGMANYVSTYTATAGTVGSKPIYGNDTPYGVAVIEAGTLNTAIADAVNSELTPIDTDPNGRLWQINDVSDLVTLTERLFLDPAIPGTSECYRSLSGSQNDNGTCSADALSYLGASGNKSGKWGVVFPYGDVSGISVCSTQSGTQNTAATSEQSAILDGEYTQQAGFGTLTSDKIRCWCKMANPTVSGSLWVYSGNDATNLNCATRCASDCSSRAASASNVAWRRTLFGI